MSIYKYDSTQDELIPLAGGATAPSSVFVGTAAEWAAETDKTDFNATLITDVGTVNAVDDTTGDTEVVANKNLVFKGTLSEWNNLSIAEKKAFDEALITDDMDTGEVVDAVTNGDMRAVTSNAVYDAINDIQTTSITLTIGSGTNNTMTLNLYKHGHIVQGVASAQSDSEGINTTIGNWFTIGTLPIGYRPKSGMFVTFTHSNSRDVEAMVQISTDGTMAMYKYIGGNFGWERALNFTFVVD